MEQQPPRVLLSGPDRNYVRVEVSGLPAITHRDEQDTHRTCFVPGGVGGDCLEKALDEVLNPYLTLPDCQPMFFLRNSN